MRRHSAVFVLTTALLLVADTVHARAGSTGTVTFSEFWLAR